VLLTNHFIFYKKAIRAEELAEIDRLKDEFISVASHELRTPVTAVIGYLDLMKDKISPQDMVKVDEDFKILNSLTKDLNGLINELLDVSRIEQKRLKMSLTTVDINGVINEVIKNLTPLAKEKNLTVNFTQISLPQIKSDPDRLRQVLTNLINNSIKYTLKGEVSITSEIKDKFIKISVKDTGIGIPADQIPNLFTKFNRIKDEKTKEVRGTGLGLWITKQIIELLGGKIYVESIYGTGSSFSFTLPITSI